MYHVCLLPVWPVLLCNVCMACHIYLLYASWLFCLPVVSFCMSCTMCISVFSSAIYLPCLSVLSCPICLVLSCLSVMSYQSSPLCSVMSYHVSQSVLSDSLSFLSRPYVLSCLSCPVYSVLSYSGSLYDEVCLSVCIYVLSRQSYQSCTVLPAMSCMCCPVVPVLSVSHVMPVLSLVSYYPVCLRVNYALSCLSYPVTCLCLASSALSAVPCLMLSILSCLSGPICPVMLLRFCPVC